MTARMNQLGRMKRTPNTDKSAPYCRQVSAGILFIAPLMGKNISVGLRITSRGAGEASSGSLGAPGVDLVPLHLECGLKMNT